MVWGRGRGRGGGERKDGGREGRDDRLVRAKMKLESVAVLFTQNCAAESTNFLLIENP